MADVFIIVDDRPDEPTSIPRSLKVGIQTLTKGHYTAELITGATISAARPDIEACVTRIVETGRDCVAGIIVDLMDQDAKDDEAGATLVERIRASPLISRLDVVVYTSTLAEVPHERLLRAGVKGIVPRNLTSKTPPHLQLARDILTAFGISF